LSPRWQLGFCSRGWKVATLPAAVLSGSMAVFLVDLLRLDGSKNVLLNRFVETPLGTLGDPWGTLQETLGGPLGDHWGDPWGTLGGPLGPLRSRMQQVSNETTNNQDMFAGKAWNVITVFSSGDIKKPWFILIKNSKVKSLSQQANKYEVMAR
jgi:hypothetical protein